LPLRGLNQKESKLIMTNEINITIMGNLMDQMEADLLKQFKAITPEQLAEEDRQRQIQREYEAKHTAIETQQDDNDEQE
jgi:hypothetical protein